MTSSAMTISHGQWNKPHLLSCSRVAVPKALAMKACLSLALDTSFIFSSESRACLMCSCKQMDCQRYQQVRGVSQPLLGVHAKYHASPVELETSCTANGSGHDGVLLVDSKSCQALRQVCAVSVCICPPLHGCLGCLVGPLLKCEGQAPGAQTGHALAQDCAVATALFGG